MESNGAASNQLNPEAPEFRPPQPQQIPPYYYQVSSQTFITEMIDPRSPRVDSLWMPVVLTTYMDPAGQMYQHTYCVLDSNYLMQLAIQARLLESTENGNAEPTLEQNNVFSEQDQRGVETPMTHQVSEEINGQLSGELGQNATEIQFFNFQGLSEEERRRAQEILANERSQEPR